MSQPEARECGLGSTASFQQKEEVDIGSCNDVDNEDDGEGGAGGGSQR